MSNLSIRSACCWYSKWDFLPSFSSNVFSNRGDRRRFYTAVKYQNYFMDKCSIFLMILHIFSCCSSVLKCLTMDNTVSMSGLCFMQIGKRKQTKNLVVEYLLFKDACIFFCNFWGYMLAIGTNPISCLLPDSCLNIPLSWKLIDGYFCLHNVIQVSFHNSFITRATTSSFDRNERTLWSA